MPHTAPPLSAPSPAMSSRTRTIARRIPLVIVLVLACLAGLDAAVYHLLPGLPGLPPAVRDRLLDWDAIDRTALPGYRSWLGGLVGAPGQEPSSRTVDASARAHGVALADPPTVILAATDALGWQNTGTPASAKVLFLGDSTCQGLGSGTAAAIPALYEAATGETVYAACHSGYGLEQYIAILRRLTVDAPAGTAGRFAGDTIYVLLSVDGDASAPGTPFARSDAANQGWLRHGRLSTLTRLALGLVGRDNPPESGAYPVPLTAPTWHDLPFAFHPAYRAFADTAWFGPDQEQAAKAALAELDRLAKAAHARLRVVLVPTALQVVYPRIDFAKVSRRTEFSRLADDETRNLNAISATFLELLHETGIPALDLTRPFMDDPRAATLYWPTDPHLTPQGNAAAVAAMTATLWPAQPAESRPGPTTP